MSLKTRLAILLSGLLLLGAVMVLFSVLQERDNIRAISATKANAQVNRVVFQQRKIIQDTEALLRKISDMHAIRNNHTPACAAVLEMLLKLHPTYVNFGVPDSDGNLYCNALPLPDDRLINVADRYYFRHAIDQQTFAIGEYQHDRAADTTSINFAYPVIDRDGDPLGAVVAVVGLGWWSQTLAQSELPENSIALITDSQKRVIAAFPDAQQWVGKPFADNDTLTGVLGSEEVRRLYAKSVLFEDSSGKKIWIHIGIPYGHYLAEANRQALFALIVIMGIIALVGRLLWTDVKRAILTPIQQLVGAAERMEAGQSGALSIDPDAVHELQQLQSNFISMAKTRWDAEQRMLRKHEELVAVFKALPDLYFRLSYDGRILEFQGSADQLYLPPEQFLGQCMSTLLPEKVAEGFRRALEAIADNHELISWEYILPIGGERHAFEARLNVIEHSTDRVLVIRDITGRKAAEESLTLSAMVFKNASEGMIIADPDGFILDVNPAFSEITGYSRKEAIGQPISMLKSGRQDNAFYASMWAAIDKTGRWKGELYNKRKNGDIYPQWISIDTIYDEDGAPFRRAAFFIDISDKKRADEIIWRQAHFDSLTKLPNRLMLYDRLAQEMKKADRHKTTLGLMFLDLDQFKEVNDTLGHDQGDELLKVIARRLQSCVRQADTVARLGGDEFTILVSEIQDAAFVEQIARSVLEVVSEPVELQGNIVHVSGSIGITLYPEDAATADELMKAADQAMYAAKAQEGNAIHFFTSSMQVEALQRMLLVSELRSAIEHEEFELHYQPIIDLSTQQVYKAEALVRWHHPERGLIFPGGFIQEAERAHLIVDIGEWVFQQVVRDLGLLRHQVAQLQVSVNVSPLQFNHTKTTLEQWAVSLANAELPGNAVLVEITESLMMDTTDDVVRCMNFFREQGIQVAVDDFGTGYSSLAYLMQYDVDYLKIDRSFVDGVGNSVEKQALCEAIIAMAHKIGLKVIAEGIETEEQQRILSHMGCDYGQGFYFAKPMPREAFSDYLQAGALSRVSSV